MMPTTKPYLIRAIHEWCTDQGFTPYLAVAVDDTTRVPRESVKNNEIVLNVGNDATNQLSLGNEAISFQARFGGKVFPVLVPIDRVMAIYARENGQGMAFEVGKDGSGGLPLKPELDHAADADDSATPEADTPASERTPRPSHLTLVK